MTLGTTEDCREYAMRKQQKQLQGHRFAPIYVLGILTAVSLVVMILVLCGTRPSEEGEFSPPPFDANAVVGVPDVPASLGYASPYREGMAYRFSVCGNIRPEDGKAAVYLTNDRENTVYLKLRILDENGSILGETGLIKPGEYVKDVTLDRALSPGMRIKLKIMGYEPETYASAGAVVLNTTVGE